MAGGPVAFRPYPVRFPVRISGPIQRKRHNHCCARKRLFPADLQAKDPRQHPTVTATLRDRRDIPPSVQADLPNKIPAEKVGAVTKSA